MLSSKSRPLRWLGVALPLLTLMMVVGAVFHFGPQRFGEALYGSGTKSPVEEVVGDIIIAGRLEIWSRALYAVRDFPVTGCGLGAFRKVAWILYPLFSTYPNTDFAHAHNIFLQTALDLGIPGLVAYLALLGLWGFTCWEKAHSQDPLIRWTALGLLASMIALHAYGLTDALALGSKPGVVLWFGLGLVAALRWFE